jgi:hypothetical protein
VSLRVLAAAEARIEKPIEPETIAELRQQVTDKSVRPILPVASSHTDKAHRPTLLRDTRRCVPTPHEGPPRDAGHTIPRFRAECPLSPCCSSTSSFSSALYTRHDTVPVASAPDAFASWNSGNSRVAPRHARLERQSRSDIQSSFPYDPVRRRIASPDLRRRRTHRLAGVGRQASRRREEEVSPRRDSLSSSASTLVCSDQLD